MRVVVDDITVTVCLRMGYRTPDRVPLTRRYTGSRASAYTERTILRANPQVTALDDIRCTYFSTS